VQNEESKQLLSGIGINCVDVVGDTRFDRVLQIKAAAKHLPLVEAFVGEANDSDSCKKVFVAGSSWQPDEDIFIPYFNEHKDWKLIIAPHVIGEDHLKQIGKLLEGRKVVRYTQATEENVREAEVLIIDCFGLLSSIYNYGSVSYIGGGFGVGIHNTLEAAVWNIPVIFGPNNKKFREAQGLLKEKGGFEITNAADFNSIMTRFINDADALADAGNKAGKYVQSLAGATDKILSKVKL
jgi:3-deoxy-D-manno-octulosonic-acid transferase